jgi:hypothetical protein
VLSQLQERFGDAVTVSGTAAQGEVTFRYSNAEELEGLLDFLLK